MFGSGGYIPPLQLPQELSRILQPDPFFRSNEVFTCSSVRILKMSIGSIPGTPTEEIVGEHSWVLYLWLELYIIVDLCLIAGIHSSFCLEVTSIVLVEFFSREDSYRKLDASLLA
jgi:hypothetical protein